MAVMLLEVHRNALALFRQWVLDVCNQVSKKYTENRLA